MGEWPKIPSIDNLPEYKKVPDWHSGYSIQLGELIEAGWLDWGEESWNWANWAYDNATYTRLTTAFNERFFDQEICITPPGIWKRKLLYKIKYELCPKYNAWYEQKARGINPFSDKDEYGKSRRIESEFPETMLSQNSDYASSGTDEEYEHVTVSNYIDTAMKFSEYREIDQMFLDELQTMFSSIWSVSVNGL